MSKVKVTAVNGAVVNQSNNPEYGYMRVESKSISFDNGFARSTNLSALISGRMEDLNALSAFDGMELPGKIQVIESLEPSHPKNAEREMKRAGEDGPVLLSGDAPIYRSTKFTQDLDAVDTKISHTNVEEVKAYNTAKAESGSMEL